MVQSESTTSQLLRIDDLAHLSGVPSRTIRFYNTQGLLPAPIMRGRVAYYTQEHALVLGIIRDLKERQNLPLEVIKQLLEIRAQSGDVQMNLALKQRILPSLTTGGQQTRLTQEELAQQVGVTAERISELVEQKLLFPLEDDGEVLFTGDDVLLLELYVQLERLGLPLALPALIRFQLRQLVRSEIAACEQHVLPLWREAELPLEQQKVQFEQILTLTDTLISVMHRKLLYQSN
ncbi:MAG TPA: MerR family transcriptional regulator [Ktedonobacteraceae bacterium]|nr:MerR family transcriptional regulator [Ktedonobacteraceae bacterium]